MGYTRLGARLRGMQGAQRYGGQDFRSEMLGGTQGKRTKRSANWRIVRAEGKKRQVQEEVRDKRLRLYGGTHRALGRLHTAVTGSA